MNHEISTFNYDEQFNRTNISKTVIEFIRDFYNDTDRSDVLKILYLIGPEGSGKTSYIKDLLKKENMDVIYISTIDTLSKDLLENILKNQISNTCILSSFKQQKKKVVILDNLYEMYKTDKTCISNILKQLKPKRKRNCKIPFICVNSETKDNKFNDLLKNALVVCMPIPSNDQMIKYIRERGVYKNTTIPKSLIEQTNFHKLNTQLQDINCIFDDDSKNSVLQTHRDIFLYLLDTFVNIHQHDWFINDNDRTSVSLLFHENICDAIENMFNGDDVNDGMDLYISLLKNITYTDYLDRATFQKQVWILNDITSIIRNISNSQLFHKYKKGNHCIQYNDIRFTKVLTKYSTEHNNRLFINTIAQKLFIPFNDVIRYFKNIRIDKETLIDIQMYDISKLDITRMYKYIDNKENILTKCTI